MQEELLPAHPKDVTWVTPGRLWWALLVAVSVGCGASLLYVPPQLVFLGVAALLGGVLLFHYPFLGILVYVIFEYLRVPAMFPALQPLQIGKIIVLSTFAAWATQALVTRRAKVMKDGIHWLMVAWVVLAFFSVVVARNRTLAFASATDLAKWAGVYLMMVILTNSPGKWKALFWALVLLNLKVSQAQLLAYVQGIDLARNADVFITEGVGVGSSGFFSTSTDLGAAMAVVAPLAFGLFETAGGLLGRGVGMIALLAFSASILRSGSRGAFVALFIMTAYYWYKSKRKLLVGLAAFAGLVLFWFAAPGAWEARFKRAANYEADPTASARITLWKAGFHMFLNAPLTGVGINNFPTMYELSTGRVKAPHSIWVQAGAELGILGLVILVGLIYLAFKRNRETRALSGGDDPWSKARRRLSFALDLSLLAFLVSGSFVTILYYPHIFIILAMIVSLNHIARRDRDRSKAEGNLPAEAALWQGGPNRQTPEAISTSS